MEIVAHRGCIGTEAQNSLTSVEHAIEAGVNNVEIDLRLTADGQWIAFHDASIPKLGGKAVSSMNLSDIKRLRLEACISQGTNFEFIPTLVELLDIIQDRCVLTLDLKIEKIDILSLNSLFQILYLYGARTEIRIGSPDKNILEFIRRHYPTFLLVGLFLLPSTNIKSWPIEIVSLHWSSLLLFPKVVSLLEDSQVLQVWTVNSLFLANICRVLGARSIVTDKATEFVNHKISTD